MSNSTYLMNLSSGNIVPITTKKGQSYVDVDTNINALLNLTLSPMTAPRYRIYILNADDTIREELPLEDMLSSGSFSENYQSGQRCSLSLILFNGDGKYTPNINQLWVGTKMRFDAGIEQYDGGIIWVQKGIFVITSVQPNYSPGTQTVSISLGDKFSELESGAGKMQMAYEVPRDSNIKAVVKELLGIAKGDGGPLDYQEPYFSPAISIKKTQAKINKSAGDTVGSLILDLASHAGAEVFYNAQGRLTFLPLNSAGDDNDKPILFNYETARGDLGDLNFSFDYSNIINKIILVGATVDGGVVRGEAENSNALSPLNTSRIGVRPSVVNASEVKTKIVAEENARYQLRKNLVLKTSVGLSVPYNPLIGVNNLITITNEFFELVKQNFLIQSVSFSLDYNANMSISVSNLNNLPFIASYKR